MLDGKTMERIKETVPILATQGERITQRFYQRMFSKNPELLNIFNHRHQRQGLQPRALADAVYAAAAHIDNLEAIMPMVTRIAHKHRSIGVRPEQYPIVGEHLLAAMKEVLGNALSPETLRAWEQAYAVIADVFIRVERELYRQAKEQPGGWEGFRNFVVDRKVKESEVITSFYLKPQDGKAIAAFRPGQYISLKAEIPGEPYTHIRQYSLSDAPGKDYYRISVKREDGKDGNPPGKVSNFLHNHVHEGDILPISAPAGDFTLDTSGTLPVVLISGGVGLTPLVSMLNTLVESGSKRDVTFIHAAINGKVHAMKEYVARLAERLDHVHSYVCYESPTEEDRSLRNYDKEGRIDRKWLESILHTRQADCYLCGPVPFMRAVYRALKEMGFPENRIHYEFFGPTGRLADEPTEQLSAVQR